MIGAIAGDIVGSPYEFNANNYKAKDFPLFSGRSEFTDDSVMTLAVAKALMDGGRDPEKTSEATVRRMQELGRRYPGAGYGGRFGRWLFQKDPKPYNSFGNGAAMRVSPVGWFCDTVEETERFADAVTAVTHNHPEGIKGARAIAVAIFLARTGHDKAEIKAVVEERCGYDLSRTTEQIRPGYHMDETCQGSVPEALICFLEGTDFEDTLRTAVSIGGDSDTIAAIAGSVAEAYYGVPENIRKETEDRLDSVLRRILREAEAFGGFRKAER
ncbi:MAG: ADP-ribosylglycohydrolase family protein [Clostridia bacterium]|nr:ADP-ribosylglycohydrolase family protein [Clostridia bacterium]